MMRAAALILLQACVAGPQVEGGPALSDHQVVEYAKSLNASQLDDSLPSQRLDDWLRSGDLGATDVSWKMDRYCNLKPSPEDTDSPTCASFGFSRNDVSVGGMIRVSQHSTRLDGKPYFENATVLRMPLGAERRRFVTELSDLPAAVAELVALPPPIAVSEILAYAKALGVAQLDPALGRGRLDEWLRLGPANGADVDWQLAPVCGRNSSPGRGNETLLCVTFSFNQPEFRAWGVVTVGTVQDGIAGSPKFGYATAVSERSSTRREIERLSELPHAISDLIQGNAVR